MRPEPRWTGPTNVTKEDMQGEGPITVEHVQNNRDLLLRRGIRPETLPPEEDLMKLERRVRSQEKQIAKRAGRITPDQQIDTPPEK